MKYRIFAVIIALLCFSNISEAQDELYQNRLDNIGSSIDLDYNQEVRQYIEMYVDQSRTTGEVLGKSAYYLEIVEDTFKKYGLPADLKYLAPALSSYNNWKVSEDGGSGFWQMRYVIARRYGLKVNSYVDERRDFAKATGAAARYLKDLRRSFNSWPLTIAAFYSDEVEVNKAIRKAASDKKYWEIHEHLLSRHRMAVPAFIAMTYMHFYAESHKVRIIAFEPVDNTIVNVSEWSTIYQLSRALETDYETLKELNPLFKKQVIPFTDQAYPVYIPSNKLKRFNTLGDSIYTYPEQEIPDGITVPPKPIIPEPRVVEPAGRGSSTTTTSSSSSTASGMKVVYYTVRRGDYLGRIADMYDVGLSKIKSWNNLRSDRINAGQRLKVYVPASKYDYYNRINSMTSAEKVRIQNKD